MGLFGERMSALVKSQFDLISIGFPGTERFM